MFRSSFGGESSGLQMYGSGAGEANTNGVLEDKALNNTGSSGCRH